MNHRNRDREQRRSLFGERNIGSVGIGSVIRGLSVGLLGRLVPLVDGLDLARDVVFLELEPLNVDVAPPELHRRTHRAVATKAAHRRTARALEGPNAQKSVHLRKLIVFGHLRVIPDPLVTSALLARFGVDVMVVLERRVLNLPAKGHQRAFRTVALKGLLANHHLGAQSRERHGGKCEL